MSDKQFANETVKVVEMTTEIDKAGAHQFSKARREDGVGGVVTEPDGDICFMGGLRSDIYITSTLFGKFNHFLCQFMEKYCLHYPFY